MKAANILLNYKSDGFNEKEIQSNNKNQRTVKRPSIREPSFLRIHKQRERIEKLIKGTGRQATERYNKKISLI